MSKAVSDIQIHAALIDDYLYIQDQPVVPAPGRFVAVQDLAGQTPVTHLFTLDTNGNLLHFCPAPTSHSGWIISQVPHRSTSGSITAVSAVFYGGVLDVLLAFDDQSIQLCRWAEADNWFYADLDGTLTYFLNFPGYAPNNTGLFIDSKGIRYLYAVPRRQFLHYPILACYDPGSALWRYVPGTNTLPSEPDASYWMEEAVDGGIGLLSCDSSSEVNVWFGSMTDAGGSNPCISLITFYTVDFGIGAITAPQVISLPGQAGGNSLLLMDSEANLFQTNGYDRSFKKLTGGTNAPAGAAYVTAQLYGAPSGKETDSSKLAIFLIERGTQRLWITRQNGTQGPGVPAFGPWVPLGNQLEAIVCAPYVAGNPEVFAVNLDMNVYRMTQDAADTIWTTTKIAGPTPQQGVARNVASTMMNIQAVDSAGTPVGGALLTVSVTTPTTLIANQLSYLAEPSAPAVIPLDETGSGAVYFQTTTLASNRLYFSVKNSDGSSAQRWCEGDLVELKQGETSPPARTDSIASKLANAAQGDLQNNGLLDPNYSDPDAAVQSINSLGTWMTGQSSTSGAWRLEIHKDSAPLFRTLTAEEAEPYFTAKTNHLGGFFGDVWGDVVNAVKNFWDDVTSVVATVTDDGINFAINIGKEIVHFVVTTARQAAAATEMIFAVIKKAALAVYDAIQEVIAWLKLLFEWKDIINTHRVLRSCFNQFLTMIVGSIGTVQNLLDSRFAEYSQGISNAFDEVANNDLFQNSFNTYVQSIQSQTRQPSKLDGGIYDTPYQQHSTQIHYVYQHAKNHFASNPDLRLPRTGDISKLTGSIQSNWNADGGFQQRAQGVHNRIAANGIAGFFDLVMKDFVLAIKDITLLLLEGVQDIIGNALELLEEAIKSLQSSLNNSIDIPVISDIYRLLTDDDLTILDLFCLVFAAPTTILYKAIFGSAPFSADSVDELNNLPWTWPISKESPTDVKALMRPSLSMPASISPAVYEVVGIFAGLSNFIGGVLIGPACDALAFGGSTFLAHPLSIASIIGSGITQVLGAPWSVFPTSPFSDGDKWNVALWAISIVPFASDTIFTVATGDLAEFTETLGPVLDTGFGLLLSALGAATCIAMTKSDNYDGWDYANSIVPWPSRFFKWCILGKDSEEAPALEAILLGADVLFGLGSTATQIGSAVRG